MAIHSVPASATCYLAYSRVSTTKQEEEGYGLDVQAANIAAYAARHGLHIAASYSDDVSGDLESRPELDKALASLRKGEVAGIIIDRPDRLARKAWIGGKLMEELHGRGLDVHFSTLGKIENTPEARFQLGIFFEVGQLDKESMLRKLTAAKRAKLERLDNPRPLNQGIPALGYSYSGRKGEAAVIVNEREAEIVRRIFDLYLGGASTTTIIETLEREGVPTVEDLRPRRHKKAGIKKQGYAKWNKGQLCRVLRNPIYIGKLGTFKTQANVYTEDGQLIKRKGRSLDDGAIVWLDVPAIIDAADWERAQTLRNDRRTERNGREYLLTHRLTCTCDYARSGWLQSASADGKRRGYYRCTGWARSTNIRQCKNGMVASDVLDGIVWEYVSTVLLDKDNLKEAFEAQAELGADERARRADTRQYLLTQLADIDGQREGLLRAEMGGKYGAALIAKMHAELDGLHARYSADLAEVDAAEPDLTERWETAEALRRAVLESLDLRSIAGKQTALEWLGVTVKAGKGEYHIYAELGKAKHGELPRRNKFQKDTTIVNVASFGTLSVSGTLPARARHAA